MQTVINVRMLPTGGQGVMTAWPLSYARQTAQLHNNTGLVPHKL